MWDTRYRPLVFADVLGQEGSVSVLRARLLKGQAFDTSYIFSGGHGSGKTSLARILARAMLCQQLREDGDPCNVCDHCVACLTERMTAFTELDAASQGTTADMRRIVDQLGYDMPGIQKRIYLLDEAHRMSRDAQDVLLKPIEDKRVVVLFCTTEFGKLRPTIKSRCETYEIRKIQKEDILGRVRKILNQEGVEFEEEAVLTVIDHERGHVRDVLNRLETIGQLGAITMDAVRERLELSAVTQYYDILLALGDASKAIELVEAACDRLSPGQVTTGIAEAAMNAYRQANKIFTDYSQLDRERAAQVYARFGAETVQVARYFLSLGSSVSRTDLVCAALSSSTGVPPAAAARVVVAPVVVTVEASPSAVAAPASPVVAPVSTPSKAVAPAPAPPGVAPAPTYFEGNVPMCPEDAAAQAGPRPRGAGSAEPKHQAKPSSRPPPMEQPPPFGPKEFTATFNRTIKSVSNVK